MPTTPLGTSYTELPGSPQFSLTRDRLQAVSRWLIDGADIGNLFAECFPEAVGITYYLPLSHPRFSYLYASDLRVEPFMQGGEPVQTWNSAWYHSDYNTGWVATITFQTVPWEQNSDDTTLRTVDVAIGGEFLRLPQWRMKWQSSGTEVTEEDIDLGMFIPSIEYSVTLHHAVALPLSTITSKVGKVNSTNDVLTHLSDETLLYLGASASRTVTWKGTGTWRITHRFSERRVKHAGNEYGWNHFWRPDAQAWQVVVDQNGDKIFEPTTFASLFTATT